MVQAVPKEVLEKSILPLIPVNRLGEPEEIARAVVFLAADEAGAITGSTLSINGGPYMGLCPPLVIARSTCDEAIQSFLFGSGLLRFARNDTAYRHANRPHRDPDVVA